MTLLFIIIGVVVTVLTSRSIIKSLMKGIDSYEYTRTDSHHVNSNDDYSYSFKR